MNVGNQTNFHLISYLGSKFTICDEIIKYFPKHDIYIEPFGGAANVLIKKEKSRYEIYNDVYSDIVNLFCVLRNEYLSKELFKVLKRTPYAEDEYNLAYEQTDDPVEKARRLIIRSTFSFHPSGIFKKNAFSFTPSKNLRNGGVKNAKLLRLPKKIGELHQRFKSVIITNRPAINLIKSKHFNRPNALFYLDPPYVTKVSKASVLYDNNYTESDHIALLKQADNLQSMVAISGYDNDIYADLLTKWKKVEINMPYRFDPTSKRGENLQRKKTIECLWLNPVLIENLAKESGNKTLQLI